MAYDSNKGYYVADEFPADTRPDDFPADEPEDLEDGIEYSVRHDDLDREQRDLKAQLEVAEGIARQMFVLEGRILVLSRCLDRIKAMCESSNSEWNRHIVTLINLALNDQKGGKR